jgi:hypothetical protein
MRIAAGRPRASAAAAPQASASAPDAPRPRPRGRARPSGAREARGGGARARSSPLCSATCPLWSAPPFLLLRARNSGSPTSGGARAGVGGAARLVLRMGWREAVWGGSRDGGRGRVLRARPVGSRERAGGGRRRARLGLPRSASAPTHHTTWREPEGKRRVHSTLLLRHPRASKAFSGGRKAIWSRPKHPPFLFGRAVGASPRAARAYTRQQQQQQQDGRRR